MKRDPLYVVYKDNKCGYINNKGKVIINPQFDGCTNFHGGRAVVRIGGVMGVINDSGKITVTPKYWVMSGYHKYYTKFDPRYYRNMMYYPAVYSDFRDGHLLAGEPKGLRGQLAKDAYFYGVDLEGVKRNVGYISDYFGYANGYYLVKKKGLYYYMGSNGKEDKRTKEFDIMTGFSDAQRFSEGLAAVQFEKKWGFINDSKGDAVFEINPQFDKAGSFKNGLAAVQVAGKWGYIDDSGQFVINPQFDEVYTFENGIACVKTSLENKYGFIDKRGNYIIRPEYEAARGFVENLSAVKKEGKWGYINKSGNWIIQPLYERAANFSEGFAVVGKDILEPDSKKPILKFGVIDKKGNEVIPFEYYSIGDYFNGIVPVNLFPTNKKDPLMLGYKDSKNKWVWEPTK